MADDKFSDCKGSCALTINRCKGDFCLQHSLRKAQERFQPFEEAALRLLFFQFGIRDPSLAKDFLQEAYLNIFERMAASGNPMTWLDQRKYPRSYFLAVVRNLVLDQLKKHSTVKELPLEEVRDWKGNYLDRITAIPPSQG